MWFKQAGQGRAIRSSVANNQSSSSAEYEDQTTYGRTIPRTRDFFFFGLSSVFPSTLL